MIDARRSLNDRLADLSAAEREQLGRRLRARQGDRRVAGQAPIPRRPAGEQPPLSFAQWRLWFLDQLSPGSYAYNTAVVNRLRGDLDAGALRRALEIVVERHEALRTVVVAGGGEPRAWVLEHARASFEHDDLSALGSAERELELARKIEDEVRRPFDLSSDVLLRARLLRLGEKEHVLVLVAHHIACDGWSKAILLEELSAAYGALNAGKIPELSPLPIQYGDFARWQRQLLCGERLAELESYWSAALDDHTHALALPTDNPRPARLSARGAVEWITVPGELFGRAVTVGRAARATPFMTMLAAFAALLGAHGGDQDILIGAPAAMRDHAGTERLIGFFANTIPYRVDLTGAPSFTALLERVRRTALDAYRHHELPFEQIVRVASPPRDRSRTPLVQANFRLEGPEPHLELSGLESERIDVDPGVARFELALELAHAGAGGGLTGYLEYATDLFQAPTAVRLARDYVALLDAATAAPDAPLPDLLEVCDVD